MDTFITTANGYFLVAQNAIDTAKLVGCEIHESLKDMLNHICTTQDLTLEEVEHNEIYFKLDEDGDWLETDNRGNWYEADDDTGSFTSIENYISTFII